MNLTWQAPCRYFLLHYRSPLRSGIRGGSPHNIAFTRQRVLTLPTLVAFLLKASVFESLNERLLLALATLMPEPRWRGQSVTANLTLSVGCFRSR